MSVVSQHHGLERLLRVLALLACGLLVLVAVASVANAPGQFAGGIRDQLGALANQAGRATSDLRRAFANAADPNHPPTGLAYDTEFSSFGTWHVGDHLPEGARHLVVLQSIARRQNAESPETTLYAVIHGELRQPNVLRLFGQVVHSDSEPHDYAVYKGETFRIAGTFYRVNWVSQQSNAMAAGAYRNPDEVNAPLKFDYD